MTVPLQKFQVIEARGHDGVVWCRMRVVAIEGDTFDATLVGFMGMAPVGSSSVHVPMVARATFALADRGVTWRPLPAPVEVQKDAIGCALAALGLPTWFGDFFRGSR